MKPRLSYLVIGVERSGTTLLCEGLAMSTVAGDPDEYFVGWWERTFWPHPSSPETYDRFLQFVQLLGTTPNGVFGAKLLWNHFKSNLEGKLRALPGKAALTAAELLASVFPNLRYIFVRRDDHLRQAISWQRAFQTNHWHSEHAKNRPFEGEIEFRFEEIKKLVQTIDRQEEEVRRFFSESGIAPFEIEYLELARDPDLAVRAVLEYLSIPAPRGFSFVPRLQQQADELTEEFVDMYELQDALEKGAQIVYTAD